MKTFPAVRIEGGLFAPDLLDKLLAEELPGQKPRDFGLDGRRGLTDQIAAVFADARDLWRVFQHRLERMPEEHSGTSVTRDAWVIPFLGLLGYELHYNRRAYQEGGLSFAVSHRAGEAEYAPPVHIVSVRQELGRVAPSGRPRMAPHSLVQEFLNRTEALWGLVTNGRVLRLLRDSTYIRRQCYVEFDLEAIFEQRLFQDFAVLYRLLHRTRLPQSGADASSCLLEQYYQHSIEEGGRARDRLRDGVQKCMEVLANGFLSHPQNEELRHRISAPESDPERITAAAFYAQILRLVYRFLFLFVAEDRGLVSSDPIYMQHYGVTRLRHLVDQRQAYDDHADIWYSLRVLWRVLTDGRPVQQFGGRTYADLLGAPVLDGGLFEPLELDSASIRNRDLLEAIWNLVYYHPEGGGPPRRVNYSALNTEELGSVYESLLELNPVIDAAEARTPRFSFAQGTERKSTGSYYTPPELVGELIKSALEPVVKERLGQARRMASGEWESIPEPLKWRFHEYVQRLPRSGGMAEGNGRRRTNLHPHNNIPEVRAVRPDGADPPGGSIDPGKHRGRLGSAIPGGVHPVSASGQWKPSGAGDPPSDQRGSGALQPRSGSADPERTRDSGQTTSDSGAVPLTEKELKSFWDSSPFAIRHSLLAEYLLLSLKILDPASGSGHFLLAAARYVGKEVARIRTGEEEPAPETVREATRDVITHCIYGVDRNPLAVELCKLALWIESHDRKRPLAFLDHHIRCGDSLVGVFDLQVLKDGIPDEAYQPRSGDDRKIAQAARKSNRLAQRTAPEQTELALESARLEDEILTVAVECEELDKVPQDTLDRVLKMQELHNRIRWSEAYLRLKKACDLWTAAFLVPLTEENRERIATTRHLRRFLQNPRAVDARVVATAEELADRNKFFHWPLEFADVFLNGGFDVVLGNPPWERVKLQEQEFFRTRDPQIASAPNAAARKRLIQELPQTNPALWEEYREALHAAESVSHFLRRSGEYPLTGRGDVNTYSVFAERMRRLLRTGGRAGIIVPTGIATDDTNKHFFADLVETGSLVSLFDFENRRGLFPHVHRSYKFSLLTMCRTGSANGESRVERGGAAIRHSPFATFSFFNTRAEDLRDPRRVFTLSAEDIARINPNTRTLPVFRTRQDAELTRWIYERVPVLVNERTGENPWGVRFLRMFDMANDSHLFRTREQLESAGYRLMGNRFVRGRVANGKWRMEDVWLPLYEAKMIWHYDHRFGTYEGVTSRSSTHLPTPDPNQHADPAFLAQPWYWVSAKEVEARLGEWKRGWLLGWRDITNATNERTVIASAIARGGSGDTLLLMLPNSDLPEAAIACLISDQCSIVHDFVARQKIGGTHLKYHVKKQLAIFPPHAYTPEDLSYILARLLEIVYTAWDMKPFADDVWRSLDPNDHSLLAIRHSLIHQWQENARETGGCSVELPPWAEAYPEITPTDPSVLREPGGGAQNHSLFTIRHFPLPPFKWDENRRARLRAELDAYYAKLYGLIRKQLRYVLDPADLTPRELEDILDPWEEVDDPLDPEGYAERCKNSDFPGETFRVLKEKEIRQYGEYRTRRLVLEAWQRLSSN